MSFWNQPEAKASFEYARAMTSHYSKSFYFSTQLLPQSKRWATYAVYGFCRYADNLVDDPRGRDREAIKNELTNLRNEIRLAYATNHSENPVVKPFIIAAKAYDIPMRYPLELINGVSMDLEQQRYKNFDDLYLYCFRVASVVGLMMTHILGYTKIEAFDYAEKLGIAMQLTNILRDVNEDAKIGRFYFPSDEMAQYGVTEEGVINQDFSDNLKEFMQFQAKRAHQYYAEAQPGIKMLNLESQYAIYSASRIYEGILFKLEARQYNPFQGRVFVSKKRKLGILAEEIMKTKMNVLKHRLLPAALL
jgi:phytoene synthase